MKRRTIPPRVLVLYNEPVLPPDHPDAESEHEILETVDVISGHLVGGGFSVSQLGVSMAPEALLSGLRKHRPDVIFNLFEGVSDQGDTEAYVAGLLQWLGVPFTGCPFQALCVARNKPLTKRLLLGEGLPTPDFLVVDSLPVPECSLEWPVIVKPAEDDASVGLDQGSVVTNRLQLEERVNSILHTCDPPILVEEYIPGREFNVALVEDPELRALPISEIAFMESGPDYWPIVTYDAKWKPGSRDFESTPARHPANIGQKLAERLTYLAMRAYRLVGCRDYARVDFRVKHPGRAYILEVNPNPDISSNAGFSRALDASGSSLAQFVVDLVWRTLERSTKSARAAAAQRDVAVV